MVGEKETENKLKMSMVFIEIQQVKNLQFTIFVFVYCVYQPNDYMQL